MSNNDQVPSTRRAVILAHSTWQALNDRAISIAERIMELSGTTPTGNWHVGNGSVDLGAIAYLDADDTSTDVKHECEVTITETWRYGGRDDWPVKFPLPYLWDEAWEEKFAIVLERRLEEQRVKEAAQATAAEARRREQYEALSKEFGSR